MKRFVTYLYECERGDKGKNVGFIRVKIQKEDSRMEVYIRNIPHSKDGGRIYVLTYKEELLGIELGEVKISNGQSDTTFDLKTENIMESGTTLNDIAGVGIQLESGGYIASCWKDAYEEVIARGEFRISTLVSEAEDFQMEAQENVVNDNFPKANFDESIIYEKIDLSQIRDLPSPNWHLATNSFLVHGFWNYGYLVLKKEMEEDKEKFSLGIPGIFEKPEAVMAILFGFPSFEEIPPEMVEADLNQPTELSQKEKNQEAAVGTFGCWFTSLKV